MPGLRPSLTSPGPLHLLDGSLEPQHLTKSKSMTQMLQGHRRKAAELKKLNPSSTRRFISAKAALAVLLGAVMLAVAAPKSSVLLEYLGLASRPGSGGGGNTVSNAYAASTAALEVCATMGSFSRGFGQRVALVTSS